MRRARRMRKILSLETSLLMRLRLTPQKGTKLRREKPRIIRSPRKKRKKKKRIQRMPKKESAVLRSKKMFK